MRDGVALRLPTGQHIRSEGLSGSYPLLGLPPLHTVLFSMGLRQKQSLATSSRYSKTLRGKSPDLHCQRIRAYNTNEGLV